MEERFPGVGEHVIACDEKSVDHDALITAVWGTRSSNPDGYPCINVVYVSDDENKRDEYGRQIDRHLTSLIHAKSMSAVHGRYWRFLDEERNAYVLPSV